MEDKLEAAKQMAKGLDFDVDEFVKPYVRARRIAQAKYFIAQTILTFIIFVSVAICLRAILI